MTKPSWTILLVDEASEERAVYRRYLQHDPVAEYRLWEASGEPCSDPVSDLGSPIVSCSIIACRTSTGWRGSPICKRRPARSPGDLADRRGQRSTRSHGYAAGGSGLLVKAHLSRDVLSGRAPCY